MTVEFCVWNEDNRDHAGWWKNFTKGTVGRLEFCGGDTTVEEEIRSRISKFTVARYECRSGTGYLVFDDERAAALFLLQWG